MTGSAELHVPAHPVRLVTAASLFDGHDAAINIMRRILQSQGCEVIHLGHNRSVDEIVTAVVQEDVQGVAVSSYQGGHDEFFRYLVDRLRAEGAGNVRVYGGGGGVIVASEIEALEAYGVHEDLLAGGRAAHGARADDQHDRVGLRRRSGAATRWRRSTTCWPGDHRALARAITALEVGALSSDLLDALAGGGRALGRPGARHHRHRRLGQVVAHRRAGPPPPPRPGGQAPDRGAGRSTPPGAAAAARCSATASA